MVGDLFTNDSITRDRTEGAPVDLGDDYGRGVRLPRGGAPPPGGGFTIPGTTTPGALIDEFWYKPKSWLKRQLDGTSQPRAKWQ